MTGLTAVIIYLLWSYLLLLAYAGPRIPISFLTKKPMDSWERTKTPTDSAFFLRAKGAHLNCVENFQYFAGLVCVAMLMGKGGVVDELAAYVVYLRIAQSTVHLIGATPSLVLVRASFFTAQVLMILYMALKLV